MNVPTVSSEAYFPAATVRRHAASFLMPRAAGWVWAGLTVWALLASAAPSAFAQGYVWTNLAGKPGGSGSTDGTGSTARFLAPSSVAVDSSGNVYVADKNSNTIRKVTSGGVVSTFAGVAGIPGSSDGLGSTARFNNPSSVAVDASGNIYVADTFNNTIRKVTPGGYVSTLAGLAFNSGSIDGTTSDARFHFPSGIAVDGSGFIYVADQNNNTLRKVTPAGVVTTLAGLAGSSPGSSDGTGSAARFNSPNGLAVDASGNVYVADTDNHTLRKVTPAGVVTTLAGLVGNFGSSDGTGSAAQFSFPYSVAVDGSGTVYVADQYNFTIRKVTSAGVVTTLAGKAGVQGSSDGTGSAARFYQPSGVTVDGSGNVFVADSANFTIRKVTSGGAVSTLAGQAPSPGSSNGTGSAARFNWPFGVAVEGSSTVYVVDTTNHTLRKVTSAGVVTTLAGLAGNSGSADGTGSTARFYSPTGVAVDGGGTIYVVDQGNHTLRKVTSAGAVTTLAGLAGSSGSADGTGSAARFNNPTGLAVDSTGNLYVADTNNSTIRKVTPGGVVSTLAGLAGNSGNIDGTGNSARFNFPTGVAVDGSGMVYIADTNNNIIRFLKTNGVVRKLAGGEVGSIDGLGAAAQFNRPSGIAVDSSGNLYVADQGNGIIRKVTPGAWAVNTIGGTAGVTGNADGLGAAAQFSREGGVAVSSTGTVFVADSYNNRISMGVFVTPPEVVTTAAGSITGTAATLNGTVNATGFSTSVSLDYGLTGAYGTTVAGTPTPVTGNSVTSVSAAIAGLSPGTLYHYRVNGTNSAGTTLGADQTFTTAFTPALWRQRWFGTTSNSGNAADSADPYHTGVTNLMVFAIFGPYQSPALVSAALLPRPQIIGPNYVISFNEPAGVSNITYGAQYATSISSPNWQPVADTGSGTLHIFSVPIAGNPQLFMRLTVTNLSP